MATSNELRYSAVARWLHWIIALLIVWNVVSGIGHEALPRDQRAVVMGLHISSGVTILVLSLVRLAWRLGHKPPPLPVGMTGWQVALAHGTHWAFYALMILLPVSGWIIVSDAPFPIRWFGLLTVPKLGVAHGSPIAEAAEEGHEVMGLVMALLVVLHVVAALWHQFHVRDNLLSRMR